jgi:Tfp pilus assembly protein PilE
MGQQQLLLIVLGVIIVGIAIAVGITMFKSSAVDANRNAVISDLMNLASKAQQYYRKPTELGGGGQSFKDFALSPLDTGNANGSYSLATSAPTDNSYVKGSTAKTTATKTLYIIGCGKEIGNDGTNPVKVYVRVTADSIKTTILN